MAEKKTTEKKAVEKKEVKTKSGKVVGGALNIRMAPSLQAERVGVLDDGTKVTILEEHGDWLKIDAGYVMAKFIQQ